MMSTLTRFSVSLDRDLVERFDRMLGRTGCPSRSKAVGALLESCLLVDEAKIGKTAMAGVVSLVYDHHRREIMDRLVRIQHDFHHLIISTQHIHLDHHNCFELVVTRGLPAEITRLVDLLKAVKGVTHCSLNLAAASSPHPEAGAESPHSSSLKTPNRKKNTHAPAPHH